MRRTRRAHGSSLLQRPVRACVRDTCGRQGTHEGARSCDSAGPREDERGRGAAITCTNINTCTVGDTLCEYLQDAAHSPQLNTRTHRCPSSRCRMCVRRRASLTRFVWTRGNGWTPPGRFLCILKRLGLSPRGLANFVATALPNVSVRALKLRVRSFRIGVLRGHRAGYRRARSSCDAPPPIRFVGMI